MATAIVEGATSEVLCDTDWALNLELCDFINSDPLLAKEVLKAVRKRLKHKSSTVQILALVLLETLVKNCGDKVQAQIIDRGVLHEMVKLAKKKTNVDVRDKVLAILESWQDFYSEPGKFPQYHDACQELMRAGVKTHKKSGASVATSEAEQTQPSQSQIPSRPTHQAEGAERSLAANLSEMSLSDIQKARGIMEVLMEMLNAVDPTNKESVKDEVIMDLVEQCSFNKQRAMQLATTTSDEELLFPALALNDDLQRVLTKHDEIASGSYVPEQITNTTVVGTSSVANIHHDDEDSEDDNGHLLRRTSRTQRQSNKQPAYAEEHQASYEVEQNYVYASQPPMTPPASEPKVKKSPTASSNGSDFLSDDDSELPPSVSFLSAAKVSDEPHSSKFQHLSLGDGPKEAANQSISTKKARSSSHFKEPETSFNYHGSPTSFSSTSQHNGDHTVGKKHSWDLQDSGKVLVEQFDVVTALNGHNDAVKPKMNLPAIPPPPAKYAERQKFFQQQQALASLHANDHVSHA